ncbi:mucin-5AC-like [Asterias rubens]|uniref:mucin-5AC-like n=1 Tax=Asterias rubens TaxID=7604 RepID=UPI0014550D6B|nr:mucin-5AC-like [Asterias rubens]
MDFTPVFWSENIPCQWVMNLPMSTGSPSTTVTEIVGDVGSTNQGSIIEESDFIDDADASDCEWEKEDSDATVTSSDDDDNLVPARRERKPRSAKSSKKPKYQEVLSESESEKSAVHQSSDDDWEPEEQERKPRNAKTSKHKPKYQEALSESESEKSVERKSSDDDWEPEEQVTVTHKNSFKVSDEIDCQRAEIGVQSDESERNETQMDTTEEPDLSAAFDESPKKKKVWPKKYNKGPFVCGYCDKQFRGLLDLTRHVRTHTNEKPLACEHCGRGFSCKLSLRLHRRTHSSARPFPCTKCDMKFANKSYLKNHMAKHSDAKPLVCKVCGFRVKYATSLRNHLRTHRTEKDFACEVCGKTFKTQVICRMHQLRHADPESRVNRIPKEGVRRRRIKRRPLTKEEKANIPTMAEILSAHRKKTAAASEPTMPVDNLPLLQNSSQQVSNRPLGVAAVFSTVGSLPNDQLHPNQISIPLRGPIHTNAQRGPGYAGSLLTRFSHVVGNNPEHRSMTPLWQGMHPQMQFPTNWNRPPLIQHPFQGGMYYGVPVSVLPYGNCFTPIGNAMAVAQHTGQHMPPTYQMQFTRSAVPVASNIIPVPVAPYPGPIAPGPLAPGPLPINTASAETRQDIVQTPNANSPMVTPEIGPGYASSLLTRFSHAVGGNPPHPSTTPLCQGMSPVPQGTREDIVQAPDTSVLPNSLHPQMQYPTNRLSGSPSIAQPVSSCAVLPVVSQTASVAPLGSTRHESSMAISSRPVNETSQLTPTTAVTLATTSPHATQMTSLMTGPPSVVKTVASSATLTLATISPIATQMKSLMTGPPSLKTDRSSSETPAGQLTNTQTPTTSSGNTNVYLNTAHKENAQPSTSGSKVLVSCTSSTLPLATTSSDATPKTILMTGLPSSVNTVLSNATPPGQLANTNQTLTLSANNTSVPLITLHTENAQQNSPFTNLTSSNLPIPTSTNSLQVTAGSVVQTTMVNPEATMSKLELDFNRNTSTVSSLNDSSLMSSLKLLESVCDAVESELQKDMDVKNNCSEDVPSSLVSMSGSTKERQAFPARSTTMTPPVVVRSNHCPAMSHRKTSKTLHVHDSTTPTARSSGVISSLSFLNESIIDKSPTSDEIAEIVAPFVLESRSGSSRDSPCVTSPPLSKKGKAHSGMTFSSKIRSSTCELTSHPAATKNNTSLETHHIRPVGSASTATRQLPSPSPRNTKDAIAGVSSTVVTTSPSTFSTTTIPNASNLTQSMVNGSSATSSSMGTLAKGHHHASSSRPPSVSPQAANAGPTNDTVLVLLTSGNVKSLSSFSSSISLSAPAQPDRRPVKVNTTSVTSSSSPTGDTPSTSSSMSDSSMDTQYVTAGVSSTVVTTSPSTVSTTSASSGSSTNSQTHRPTTSMPSTVIQTALRAFVSSTNTITVVTTAVTPAVTPSVVMSTVSPSSTWSNGRCTSVLETVPSYDDALYFTVTPFMVIKTPFGPESDNVMRQEIQS